MAAAAGRRPARRAHPTDGLRGGVRWHGVRRTKILATLGPASHRPETIRELLSAGADAVRLNLAHGTSAEHRRVLRDVRSISRQLGREVAVVADIPGPKLRLGLLRDSPLELHDGDRWRLDRDPTPGGADRVGVELPRFSGVARKGDPILLGDGVVALRVLRASSHEIEAVVVHGGSVGSHSGVYLPRARLRTEVLGRTDRELAATAVEGGVDFLALSFVRNARDVRTARAFLATHGAARSVGLIAKIERAEAVEAIDAILAESDGIMVARGDLGIELPLERLPLEQKRLVRRANVAGRFAIVATQMLLSMLRSPRPTRAEATDVANAVLDGADAVMLSEESAVGAFPVEAVRWLARIAATTEPAFDPGAIRELRTDGTQDRAERSVAAAAVHLAEAVDAGAIVTPTHSGRTARLVASLHPPCPVLALSHSGSVRRRLSLVGGVVTRSAPAHSDLPRLTARARALLDELRLDAGGPAVLTAGYPVEGRPTNLLTLLDPAPERRRRRSARGRRGSVGRPRGPIGTSPGTPRRRSPRRPTRR